MEKRAENCGGIHLLWPGADWRPDQIRRALDDFQLLLLLFAQCVVQTRSNEILDVEPILYALIIHCSCDLPVSRAHQNWTNLVP